MALLNYAKTYAEVSGKLQAAEGSADYFLLIFTKDGHIITHGYDYTAVSSTARPGLLNKLDGNVHHFLNGTNTWAALTTADLPIASSLADINTNKIFNTSLIQEYVHLKVNEGFLANDAMRFKGTIKRNADGTFETTTVVNGETTVEKNFPKTFHVGDTYRVTANGNYISSSLPNYSRCAVGDLLIAIKDSTDTTGKLNTDEYWTIVEANINGTATYNINGNPYVVYSNSTENFTIYAPTTTGAANQVLISTGDKTKTPTWANQSTIIAGNIIKSALDAALQSVTLNHATGQISVKVWGTTKTSEAPTTNDTWNLNIRGQAARVANALSIKGAGLKLFEGESVATSYNGSKAISIALQMATTTTLGGVIIDTNSGIGRGEGKPTISISETGVIFLTKENISNALGFDPILASQVTKYDLIVGSAASSTTTAASASNPYINLIGIDSGSNRAVTGDVRVMGAGHTSVTAKNDVITVSSSWRDVQIGGKTINNDKLNFVPSGDVYLKKDDTNAGVCDISFGLSWYNITTKQYETV